MEVIFFLNNTNFSFHSNIPTPSNYQLGIGDFISIEIWGDSEIEYIKSIDKEGRIKLPKIAPIYLNGLSISQAKVKIRRQLEKIYKGLVLDENDEQKIFFDVNLLKSRSVNVAIVGEVTSPGNYIVPGYATLINVLQLSSGPSEIGSYRNIKLFRRGKLITTFDFYDFILKGKKPNYFLEEGDLIIVPPFEKRVLVSEGFKRKGIFEIKDNETLEDILQLSSGFETEADKNIVFIERFNGIEKNILQIQPKDLSTISLYDGDILSVKIIRFPNFDKKVKIEGNVFLEGYYNYNSTSTLKALINISKGTNKKAYLGKGFIYRKVDGIEKIIKSFSVVDIIQNSINIDLKPDDRVVILSQDFFDEDNFIYTAGALKKPDTLKFYDGITLKDAIILSGGTRDFADLEKIELYRDISYQSGVEKTVTLTFNFNKDSINFELLPNDFINVRYKSGFEKIKYVSVRGMAKRTGLFPIKRDYYTVKELFEDIGGVRNYGANFNEMYIERKKRKIDTILFRIPIKAEIKNNKITPSIPLVLNEGDIINIPKLDNTISIIGAIQNPSIVNYKEGIKIKKIINLSGGFKRDADKKKLYVIYQNGEKSTTKRKLFAIQYPKVRKGAKVVVPIKEKKEKRYLSESIITFTSLISSFAIIYNFLR